MSVITAKATSQTEWWLNVNDFGFVINGTTLEVRNESGVVATLRVAGVPASGQTNSDVPNFLNLQGVGASMQFSFAGASAPSAGTNTGKFGFCHTSGGAYTAGKVYYDTGSAVTVQEHIKLIVTTSAVTGTISLIANGIYALESGTWTLKGDGSGASTAGIQTIAVSISYNSSSPVVSTTAIPDTATIMQAKVTTTAWNGTSPSLIVTTDGSSPVTVMTVTNDMLKNADQYVQLDTIQLGSNKGGHLSVAITPDGSTAGTAIVYVSYVTLLS